MAATHAWPAQVRLRPTTEADLGFVLAAERHPDNASFVCQWPRERHQAALADPDVAHRVIEEGDRAVGFLIFMDVLQPHRSVQLRRMVVQEKGRGLGRAALRLAKRAAFGRFGAHRLWLDVMEHNARARALYESEGFRLEGTLRECLLRDDRWVSLHLLSLLDREYFASGARP